MSFPRGVARSAKASYIVEGERAKWSCNVASSNVCSTTVHVYLEVGDRTGKFVCGIRVHGEV